MTTVQSTTQEKFVSNHKTVKELLDDKLSGAKKPAIEIGIAAGEGLFEFGSKCGEKIANDATELMQKVIEYQEIIGNEELSFGQKVNGVSELMVENSPVYKIANWAKGIFNKPKEQE